MENIDSAACGVPVAPGVGTGLASRVDQGVGIPGVPRRECSLREWGRLSPSPVSLTPARTREERCVG